MRKESPAGQNRSRDFLRTNLAACAFNRHCACALFFSVALSLSFVPFLFHSNTKVEAIVFFDSSTLPPFFFPLSHASSFSRAMHRRILLLVPFPRWKPARLFPSLTPSISVFLLSHLTTPLASERYVTYIVGYPSFARAIVDEYSFVTIGQRRIFDDYYRSYTIKGSI